MPKTRMTRLLVTATVLLATSAGARAGVAAGRMADRIEIVRKVDRLVVGQRVRLEARVVSEDGAAVDRWIAWRATSSSYVSLAADGRVTGVKPGRVTILAVAGDLIASFPLEVVPNTIAALAVSPAYRTARAGDTLHFRLDVSDTAGAAMPGLAAGWSVEPADAAAIDDDGVRIARSPGLLTVTATIADRKAVATVRVAPRR
jgi:hypothetical protein